MNIAKYELQVVPGHRYNELSIRLRDGVKVWVNKDQVTTLEPEQLAKGEDKVIDRYEHEGRMVVVRVEPPPPPKPKRSRRAKPEDDDDLEE